MVHERAWGGGGGGGGVDRSHQYLGAERGYFHILRSMHIKYIAQPRSLQRTYLPARLYTRTTAFNLSFFSPSFPPTFVAACWLVLAF